MCIPELDKPFCSLGQHPCLSGLNGFGIINPTIKPSQNPGQIRGRLQHLHGIAMRLDDDRIGEHGEQLVQTVDVVGRF